MAAGGVAGLALFIYALPSPNQPLSEVRAGDGIVVPTGGYARVATGLDLLAMADVKLLITGVYPETTLESLLAGAQRPAPACCLELDYSAGNTAGNAAAAVAWAEANGLDRIHLVTSWYHMPRSRLLFQSALPSAAILPHPVFPADGAGPWWLNARNIRLVLAEYAKFLWAWTRLQIGGEVSA